MSEAFNINKWYEDCDRYEKNRRGMNLNASVTIINNSTINIHILSMDAKYEAYREQVKALMTSVAHGAIQVMCDVFHCKYAEEADTEEESKRNFKAVSENMEKYLNLLFSEGKEKYLSIIMAHALFIQASYQLAHMEYSEDGWQLANGYHWTSRGWEKDDRRYTDYMFEICRTMIPTGSNVSKKEVA